MTRYYTHQGPLMTVPHGLYPKCDGQCVAAADSGRCSLQGDKETGLCFARRKNVFIKTLPHPTVHHRTRETFKGLKAY